MFVPVLCRDGVRRLAPAALLLAFLAAPLAAQARAVPESFADLVERLSPAVVGIATERARTAAEQAPPFPFEFPPGSPFEEFFRRYFGQPGPGQGTPLPPRRSAGSGFIVDADGIVVTSNHVIDGADVITVTLDDDTALPAKVIGSDPKTDIAVLKVEASRPLPTVAWGDSDEVRVGDWSLAIGNPFGFGGTVTAGIISARARSINAGLFDEFLQTDAPINPGNSGGPLFSLAGEVIGINTAIVSPSGGNVGIGFAIPSSLAAPIVEQIVAHGRIIRGWLGVQIQTVTDDIAASLGLEEAAGALVARVSESSPAARAGIETGDVVVAYDGRAVEDPRSLARMVAATAVGRTVAVELVRKGRRRTLEVTIAELVETSAVAAPQPGSPSAAPLGLTLAPPTPELAERYGIDRDAPGVVVVAVKPGSPAAQAGVRPGDLIVEVGETEVRAAADVEAAVAEAESAGREAVLILVERAGNPLFLAAPLGVG
jgi:serine protease Do